MSKTPQHCHTIYCSREAERRVFYFCFGKQKFVLLAVVHRRGDKKLNHLKLRERNETCDLLMSRDALGGWHTLTNAFCICGLINAQLLLVLKRIWRASLI